MVKKFVKMMNRGGEMGKVLIGFYFIVGLLCAVCVLGSIIKGEVLLVSWLLLAGGINFFLFYIVWKDEKAKMKERRKLKLVRTYN